MPGVSVRVPASTANIGPGYDAFGLALGVYDTVSAELSRVDEWHITVLGDGPGIDDARTDNRAIEAMKRVFAEAGEPRNAARVFVHSGVPVGVGLGSSAAAIVGGAMAANELIGRPFGRGEIFRIAARMEGHPDNAAAALYGGFAVAWTDESGPESARLEPAAGLAVVAAIGDMPVATGPARDLLPANVTHEDAAFTAGRASLLALGIALGRRDLVVAGATDRLHERFRTAAVPDLEAVREALLAAGADAAVLSGSGPTLVGLVSDVDDDAALRRANDIAERARTTLRMMPGRGVVHAWNIDREGAVVSATGAVA